MWKRRASGSAVGSPCSSGLITLDVKHTRERSAIIPHAAFDVAGTGNVAGFTLRRRASPRPYGGSVDPRLGAAGYKFPASDNPGRNLSLAGHNVGGNWAARRARARAAIRAIPQTASPVD